MADMTDSHTLEIVPVYVFYVNS